MFTVKHVSPTGAESLYPASEVNYLPAFADQAIAGAHDTLWYTDPKTKEIKSIESGAVFVTNEAGATVAKYRLNENTADPVFNDNVTVHPMGTVDRRY